MKMRKLQIILILSFTAVIACGGIVFAATNSTPVSGSDSVVCAVCGMQMLKKDMVAFEHRGKKYHVCTNDEKAEFLKNPRKYSGKK